MKKTKKLDMWTVLSFVILLCYAVFLLYPMLNLLRQSVVTIDGAFTLEYFQKFFGKSYYLITLWNSFKVSIAVTIITLIIGVPLAYLYNMYEIKGKGLLQIIIILCSMSAPFIGAYSWILMLGNSGIIRKAIKSVLGITLPSIYGFNGILLVLSLQLFPLVFLYVSGAMKNINNSLLEAAESMGCKGIKRFLTVIVPLCMPSILAAMLLVFMRAFADFGTPLLIGQGYRTFPVEIYNAFFSETTGGDYGFACATSVIAIVITTVVFLVQKWSSNKFSFTMNALHPVERKKAHGPLNVLIHLFTYLVVGIAFLPQVYIFYESFRKTSGKAFVPGYSLDSYRSAMETAGYTSGEKSVSVTMLVNEENSFKVSMARKLASDLSQYDVKIDVKTLPYEDYLAALKAGDFDLYYGECKLTADWDLSPLLSPGGALNYGGVRDTQLETLLTAFRTASEGEGRQTAARELCSYLKEQAPLVAVCFKSNSVLLPEGAVKNDIHPTVSDPFADFQDWQLNMKS